MTLYLDFTGDLILDFSGELEVALVCDFLGELTLDFTGELGAALGLPGDPGEGGIDAFELVLVLLGDFGFLLGELLGLGSDLVELLFPVALEGNV